MLSAEEIAKLPSSKLGLREPVEDLRRQIGQVAASVKQLKADASAVQQIEDPGHRGEAIANVQLAYRHLEDARMRLGKVLQAADGGVSILDR